MFSIFFKIELNDYKQREEKIQSGLVIKSFILVATHDFSRIWFANQKWQIIVCYNTTDASLLCNTWKGYTCFDLFILTLFASFYSVGCYLSKRQFLIIPLSIRVISSHYWYKENIFVLFTTWDLVSEHILSFLLLLWIIRLLYKLRWFLVVLAGDFFLSR